MYRKKIALYSSNQKKNVLWLVVNLASRRSSLLLGHHHNHRQLYVLTLPTSKARSSYKTYGG